MTYNGYIGTVHYSEEDNVFYGNIHGINDLVTFEGQSVSELKNAFHASINDYLKTCKILSKSPDKTYKGSFNVRLTSRLHKLAVINALKNNITLNDFVKKAISNAITL